jgi:septal ring factor EnvC (AmiA/AmiB activator)
MKLWLSLGALGIATALAAQTDPRARLASAQSESRRAQERSAVFEARAKASADAAARARAEQAALAARIQAAEAEIAGAEARLVLVGQQRRDRERRLAAKQQPIIRLMAALQTMARRPAAAALVEPGSIEDLVRIRALLTSMEPQIRARTAGLRIEVDQARQLHRSALAAAADLRAGQSRLRGEQQRLARLEAQQRQRSLQLASSARLEAQRAAQIGESSRDLMALVRDLDADAALRERLASLPGPLPRPARLFDALPVDPRPPEAAGLRFHLPAIGPVVRGFGEMLPSGARSRGISIGARAGAIVVAPADGRITFAGLFRGYGAIAILDHGRGYTSLITGLASNIARVGDPVQQGSPLGRAGANGITVELRRNAQPLDLSQFVA